MPARDLLVVVLRVVGLYFVILDGAQIPAYLASGYESLYYSTAYPHYAVSGPSPTVTVAIAVLGVLQPILSFSMGAVLVLIAPRVALRCYPSSAPPEEATLTLESATLLRAGLRVLGVLLLFWAIEPLIACVNTALLTGPNQAVVDAIELGAPFVEQIATLVAYALLGGWLVLRGDAVTDRLRGQAADPPDVPRDAEEVDQPC